MQTKPLDRNHATIAEAPTLDLVTTEPLNLERAPSAEQLAPRCNLPINLNNWKDLSLEIQEQLTWFHQHILDVGLTNAESAKALGYEYSVVFQALKGTYKGSYDNVADRIVSYRKIVQERAKIQNVEFCPSRNTKLIEDALDYAVASNTITLIIGEARMSKSMTLRHWRDNNNSGRTILVEAPSTTTRKTLLREICHAIGHKESTVDIMHQKILKALNKGRTLIIDEAHFLLPTPKANPICLETLRKLHDRTKCGLALVATARFGEDLMQAEYQFEQLLGRIGLPVRLYRELKRNDIEPLVEQYFVRATDYLVESALAIINNKVPDIKGRYGALVEIYRHASRLSSKERGPRKMNEQHFKDALATRRKMMGEFQYARH